MRKRVIAITGILSIASVCLVEPIEPVLAASTTQSAATQPATTTAPAAAITWDEAAKHVGETVTVTGPVVGTHVTAKKQLVLNLGKDYPDTGRFSIMIDPAENESLSEDTYKGKTVTVTGKITLYRKAPEVICKSSDLTVEQ